MNISHRQREAKCLKVNLSTSTSKPVNSSPTSYVYHHTLQQASSHSVICHPKTVIYICPMPNKILIAITGASGAIYAKLLLDKLASLTHQWQELSIVMSNNAKEIW